MARSITGSIARMLDSISDLVCNGSEAGAHLMGAAKERTIVIEENSQALGALSALDNITRTAERLADVEKFKKSHPEAYSNAEAFLGRVAQARRSGLSPYETVKQD